MVYEEVTIISDKNVFLMKGDVKEMKKKICGIISLIISVSVICGMLPMHIQAEEVIDKKMYQLDLSDKFNYSNWGMLEETITSETVDFEKQAGAFLFYKTGSKINTFQLNDEMTFTFDTSTYSINKNNFYKEELNETAVFTGHEKFVKTVYMGITLYKNHSDKIYPVINYTDGTTETVLLEVANYKYASEKPNYAGAMTVSAPHLGAKGWKRPANNNGVVGETKSDDGIAYYSIDVDETKIIDNISITNSSDSMVAYYAIGGTVMSNNELLAYVDNAQTFERVTAENADAIKIAKSYADELVARNAVTESYVEKINSLYEDVIWYADKIDAKQNMLNLSSALNMDMLAPVGSSVDNYFDTGFECTYTDMWKKHTVNGVISAELDDGSVVNFSMDESKYDAGVKDAVYLKAGETTVTIPSAGEPAQNVYFIWGSRGDDRQAKVTVKYSDGTSKTETVAVHRYVKKDADPNEVGSLMLNLDKYYPVFDENTGKYIITSKLAETGEKTTAGINIYCMELDITKTPVSYAISAAVNFDTALFAMTETTMSNDDMISVIDEVKGLKLVKTAEDAEAVEKAWAYAQELDRRHAVKLEDNAYIKKLVKQTAAQKDIHIDITSELDADLIVNVGDSRPSGYSGRDDALHQAMGSEITLISPRGAGYTDEDSGRTFNLSGAYDGNGNDSVQAGVSGVSFGINNKVLSRISFLIDCIDTRVSKNNGATVKAVITYDDGTSEEVKSRIRRSDTWYTNQYGAFVETKNAHYDSASNTYADGRVNYENEEDKFSLLSTFGFNIPTAKPVKSIELCGEMSYTYHVLGVTAVPHSNEELENNLVIFETVSGALDVNESNAQAALLGASSALELYARGYELDSDSIALANEVYMAARVYLSDGEVLEFVPSLTMKNGIASVSVMMNNTTADDAPYVIIIAAYNDKNELAGIKASSSKLLKASSVAVKDSLMLDEKIDNAVKYKAMIWDGLDTMHPYSVSE